MPHTPGPWFSNGLPTSDKPEYRYAAAVWNTDGGGDPVPHSEEKCICTHYDNEKFRPSIEETGDNMRLIAAAPDLLAACQLVDSCNDDSLRPVPCWYPVVRAAIAKALGT